MRISRCAFNKQGFTITEAVAATIILGIGVFIIGSAFFQEYYTINKLREITLATLAAQEEIENIRGMTFDAVSSLGTSFTASGFTYLKNPTGTLKVDDIYNDTNIRRVSVAVSWHSLSGQTLTKSLVTLVTRSGIDKQ